MNNNAWASFVDELRRLTSRQLMAAFRLGNGFSSSGLKSG